MLRLHTLRRLAAAADAIAQPSFLRPLTSGAGSGQQAAGFAAGGLAEEREYSEHDGGGPLDDRRTVEDYNRLLAQLGNRKRGYLMRDVLDEMSLNGVRPNRRSYTAGLFAAMAARKLGDALFFWEEMQRHGIQPDTAAYNAIISACGRCGQLERAAGLKREMAARGVAPGRGTFLALLHAYSEAGRLQEIQEVFEEMEAAGFPADEHAFAAWMDCFCHVHQRSLPPDAEQQLLGLLELSLERLGDEPAGASSQQQGPPQPRLVVYNAVLKALGALGLQERAVEVFEALREEGLQPNSSTYANIIRCHLARALGSGRQPTGTRLTALIEERLRGVDLSPYVDQVLADREARRAAGAAYESSSEEEGGGEAEEGRRSGGDAAAAEGEGGETGEQGGEDGGAQQREERVVLSAAQQRARARVRFDIMAEHIDVEAWYQALHVYQEVLDSGAGWGPDIATDLVRTGLELASAGVDDAVEVAAALLDKFEEKGLFLDVPTGSELLLLAARRDVGNLCVAHRVWELLRRGGRVPRSPAAFKYMRALCLLEAHKSPQRLREVCDAILNDPDRSEAALRMKSEARRRKQVFGGAV